MVMSWKQKLRGFRGHIFPITTPFNPDLSIDLDGLSFNIDQYFAIPGCAGIYFGSVYTEFWTMTMEERKAALEVIVRQTRKRGPVIAGVSSPSVTTSLELAQHAESIGADMVMIWPPIFGPRDEEGVLTFYRAICSRITVPVCVYSSILSELGFYLTPTTLAKLTEFENIVAVKEASFSLTTYLSLLDTLGHRLAISTPFEEYWIAGR